MKKIEPTAYQLANASFVNADDITVGDIARGVTPLYTREAFEAAMEAMKRECMLVAKEWAMSHVEVDHAPHGVDDEISKYVSVYDVLENIVGE